MNDLFQFSSRDYLLLEQKRNLLVGELSVNRGEGLGAAFNVGLVLGIKVNLHDSLSISLHPSSLSNNFRGVHDVVQDGLVNSRQCSRTRARSIGLLVTVVRLSENGTLSDDQNVLSREFLFQLTDKFLVDLIDRFQKLEGDIQDDGLASATVDLLGGCDVNVSERSLKLGRSHFKIEKFIGYRLLELIGFLLYKRENLVRRLYSPTIRHTLRVLVRVVEGTWYSVAKEDRRPPNYQPHPQLHGYSNDSNYLHRCSS